MSRRTTENAILPIVNLLMARSTRLRVNVGSPCRCEMCLYHGLWTGESLYFLSPLQENVKEVVDADVVAERVATANVRETTVSHVLESVFVLAHC